uniref:Dual oxidase 2 n=2 Tax=Latimeria chalumnae TaxID=7897 RepID=H3ABE7_LATCH
FYNGYYPFYPQERSSSFFNMQQVIIILVFLVCAVSFLIILPGIRGKGRLFWFLRIILSLFIGVVIVAVNFTSDWETGSVQTSTSYKSFSNVTVDAEVGLYVGLEGVNITLKGNPVHQINETIDYNEQFSWRYRSNYDDNYYHGLQKGLPNPILYIAEKFTLESPCRVYAQYRLSGHYASAMLWVAFCAWIVSNILFSLPVLAYGGFMMVTTGTFMIFSILSFSTIRNTPLCSIYVGSAALSTQFGPSFWLTLAIGLLCILIGLIVILMDQLIPEKLKMFFMLNEDDGDDVLLEGYGNNSYIEDTS